ncbi:MAG: hypothetical protein GPOALKHO_000939 [Sodalis sp.]|nr:MAG: hypothetical protein GPOALKHO_000939 [Sodalis sp.]
MLLLLFKYESYRVLADGRQTHAAACHRTSLWGGRPDQFDHGAGTHAGPGRLCCIQVALEAWSDTLCMDLHGSGVRVSLIEQGPIAMSFSIT